MLVARVLVPVDADVPRVAGGTERPRNDVALGSPAVAVPEREAGFVLRKGFFSEAMLENSPTKPPRRGADFIVSAAAQTIFLAALLLLPLYFTEAPDIHQFNKILLATPPPPAAPPPAPLGAARPAAAPKRNVVPVERQFVVPRAIPRQVARVTEEPDGNDLAAALSGEGIPGGVAGGTPGGLAGGVLGGGLLGTAPPAPPRIDSAPKQPIRVGGQVKQPRLIFGPEPEYPLLARRAKISGAVVIDAVIDTQGNVVDMHPVSGNPLLEIAAMAALLQWKYEPTLLGGQAYPVRTNVTIIFKLKKDS